MNQQEILDYLKTMGYVQYHWMTNTLVKDNHTVSIEDNQVVFEDTNTLYEEREDLDYFESPEDVWSWVQGWLDDILDQEELEEE